MKKNTKHIYDCLIIGAGPSGVQAAVYLLRANKKVLVVFKSGVGSLSKAQKIDNYYGVDEISGKELDKLGKEKIKKLGAELLDAEVVGIEKDYGEELFVVTTEFGDKFCSKAIIIAVGSQIKNNSSYQIKTTSGVSYCALCDGFFYKKKEIAIVGSGKFMLNEFKHLKNVTDNVTILSNGKFEDGFVELKNAKIVKEPIKTIEKGSKKAVKIKFEKSKELEFDGVFVAEGRLGATAFSKLLGIELGADGHLKVDKNMQTNILGVFACGDVVGGLAQISKAVSDGAAAGLGAIKYLEGRG